MKPNVTIILLAWALFLVSIGCPAGANARVDVDVNIVLPPVVISSPPEVVVIPGTYVYFVPDVEVDIVFYHGYWYRPYRGYWYRATSYQGPWVSIVTTKVPRVLIDLPPGFRQVPPGHQRIPYGQLKKNWRTWEREKYWDRHGGKERYKEEKREYKEEKRERKEGKGKGKGKHKDD